MSFARIEAALSRLNLRCPAQHSQDWSDLIAEHFEKLIKVVELVKAERLGHQLLAEGAGRPFSDVIDFGELASAVDRALAALEAEK